MTIREGFKVVEAFLAAVEISHKPKAVFRGHASEAWSLTPPSFRSARPAGIIDGLKLNRWKAAAARFADKRTTNLEWLVLAQHFGVPTPLLDWTTNPLIALYFASANYFDPLQQKSQAGMIYALDGSDVRDAPSNEQWNPFAPYEGPPMIINTLLMNSRTLAQDSVMTLHQFTSSTPNHDFDLGIFRVSPELKRSTLEALRVLGVSSDRVFPDISVAAREYADELKQEDIFQHLIDTMVANGIEYKGS